MDAMARTLVQFVIVTFFVNSLVDATANTAANELPRIFILHPSELAEARKQLQEGDPALQPALRRLRRDADHALKSEIYSVTLKQQLPPSGDKHDYLSVAPYWWPNPITNNGLPYVRRDGEINPERDRIPDRKRLDQLVQGVKTLALTYYFTGVASYKEITSLEPKKLAPSLRRAALAYGEPRYEEAIAKLPKLTGDEPWRLLYPNSTNR
jgi:hypothetical protein